MKLWKGTGRDSEREEGRERNAFRNMRERKSEMMSAWKKSEREKKRLSDIENMRGI